MINAFLIKFYPFTNLWHYVSTYVVKRRKWLTPLEVGIQVSFKEVSYMTQNQIAYWNLQETKRTNRAREEETHRSNVTREELQADIQKAQKSRMAVQNVTDFIGGAANLIGAAGKTASIFI